MKSSESYLATLLWSSPASWHEANRTIKYLIQLHRKKLGHVSAIAGKIQTHLFSLFPIMDELCSMTCPWCPEPCCSVARVWADFQDLLFLHLNGHLPPPTQLISTFDESCQYLGHRGCVLNRVSRPWICTRYICPPQMAKLRKNPSQWDAFERSIQAIKIARKEMEAEFIQVITYRFPEK